jgi:hypothetical protein
LISPEAHRAGGRSQRKRAGINDFTSDATDDLLQRHDDGTFQFQHIQNSLVTSTVTLGPVGTEWFNI